MYKRVLFPTNGSDIAAKTLLISLCRRLVLNATDVSRSLRALLVVSSVFVWGTAGVGCGGGDSRSEACDACLEAARQCHAQCDRITSNCTCNDTVCVKPCAGQ